MSIAQVDWEDQHSTKKAKVQLDQDQKDWEAIRSMLDSAAKYNMQVEAVWSFEQAIRHGNTITEACWFAICEWDL